MRDLYWLADEPMARLSPYCPKIGGKLRVAALLDDLPQAQRLLGDRGHAADWFRGGAWSPRVSHCASRAEHPH